MVVALGTSLGSEHIETRRSCIGTVLPIKSPARGARFAVAKNIQDRNIGLRITEEPGVIGRETIFATEAIDKTEIACRRN
jgi:hypothetical protein